MQDQTPRPPAVPKPPSKQDIDQFSQEQGLITDEWAKQPEDVSSSQPS